MKPKVAQVVFNLPVPGPFDYRIPADLQDKIRVGHRVEAPFNRRQLIGIVVRLRQHSRLRQLKTLSAILDPASLVTEAALTLAKEFSEMYGCSLGEAIAAALPAGARSKKALAFEPAGGLPDRKLETQNILCLDPGVDGRWPVMIEALERCLAFQANALVLVPEAAMLDEVRERLTPLFRQPPVVLGKHLTPKTETQNWLKVRSGQSRLVIGTRSAVFAPIERLGLIVMIDEENPGYKQDQTPYYHTRDVVLLRSRLEQCSLLFVSVAPSVELWRLVRQKKFAQRECPANQLAPVRVIDLSNYKSRKKAQISFGLQNHIRAVLARGGKALLLLNRRGFSTMIRCKKCDYTVRCPRCDVNLIFLFSKKKLYCPLCQTHFDLPETCPQCQATYLRYWGGGIEKVESEAARLFPQSRVGRYDRETSDLPRDADILVTTQAVTRMAGQLNVDMVGVLDVDTELSRVDFRCTQKVFSLLTRMRQMAREAVYIQTFWPDHPCLSAAVKGDPEPFYRQELKSRRQCALPPFVQLVAVAFRGRQKQKVMDRARAVYEKLKAAAKSDIEVLEPQPDFVPKLRDKYRFTVMVKGKTLKKIIPLIKTAFKAAGRKGQVVEVINVNP